MTKKIKFFGVIFCLSLVSLQAQTQYFHYYKGEKQYLTCLNHDFQDFKISRINNLANPENLTKIPVQTKRKENKLYLCKTEK